MVRVIAPARSLSLFGDEIRARATEHLATLGLHVTFGRHVEERNLLDSSSISSRLDDLHDAFTDPAVAGVITAIGGYNSNQLLPGIDWRLIGDNPKVLCGFSDITVLQNAILTKSDLVTYSGPHFTTFGIRRGLDQTIAWFRECLMAEGDLTVVPAKLWTDDPWSAPAHSAGSGLEPHPGWWILREGTAAGRLVGGNLGSLSLLTGTEFFPDLTGAVVMIEEDAEEGPLQIQRTFVSLTQQAGFSGVRGILVGRFQKRSRMTRQIVDHIVGAMPALAHIPIIANLDFGHTYPMLTLPIGGHVTMCSRRDGGSSVVVTTH